MKLRRTETLTLCGNVPSELRRRMNSSQLALRSIGLLIALSTIVGCGGGNGLVGGGQGNPVFLTSITMTPVNPSITFTVSPEPPATTQFVVIGTYSVGNPKDITDQVTWTSLDSKVATVNSKGMATATGSGRVVITAQIFEPANQKTLQASTVFTVIPQLTGIQVSPATAQIAKNTSQQFTATGKYNDGTQTDITSLASWSSSSPVTATASSSPGTHGRATAFSPGTAKISASLGSFASSADLNVTSANLLSVSIRPANPTVSLRGSQQLSALGTFDDGSSQDISTTVFWNSSDARLARVTSTGTLSGVGIGQAQVTVATGALSDTSNVTVDASSVLQVSVLPLSRIASGTRVQLHAVATLQDGAVFEVSQTPGILWTSSNTAVANIASPNGVLTAAAPGAVTISAELGTHTGSTTLNVSDATIQSVSVAPDPVAIAPGTTQNMIALATFSDGSGTFQQDVSSSAAWSSDNTTVATLSFADRFQELAIANSTGVANLTASVADAHGNVASSSSVFNVSSATLATISVVPGAAGLTAGGGQQFMATGNFSDGTRQDLTLTANWSAADAAITDMDPYGFSIASGPGQTSVAAQLGSQTGSGTVVVSPGVLRRTDICAVNVIDPLNNCPPLDPLLPPLPISFAKNVPFGLIAIGTFTDGSREDLTSSVRWSSSNAAFAAISNEPGVPGLSNGVARQGFVTGFVAGHVSISASTGGVSGSTDVIVTDFNPAFLTVAPTASSVHPGLTQQLTATLTFGDSTTVDVTPYAAWTTSNPAAVIVYPGGLAYPSGIGISTVTASFDSVQGSTTMTIQ